GAGCSRGSSARRWASSAGRSQLRSGPRSARAATRCGRTWRGRSRPGSASRSSGTGSSTCGRPPSNRSRTQVRLPSSGSTSAPPAIPSSSSPNGGRGGRVEPRVSSPSSAETIHANYERIKAELGPEVTIVAATKYVDDLSPLVEAGIEVGGENRAQDLEAKHARHGTAFRWHFIGHLQGRKAKTVNEICELCHSLASESAARRLEIPALVEVNLSGEESKSGIAPDELERFLELGPEIRGLMTMPPPADDPESSRPYFRRLRELAAAHGLRELSMGTSQDYRVAVEEGATLIRVGSILY